MLSLWSGISSFVWSLLVSEEERQEEQAAAAAAVADAAADSLESGHGGNGSADTGNGTAGAGAGAVEISGEISGVAVPTTTPSRVHLAAARPFSPLPTLTSAAAATAAPSPAHAPAHAPAPSSLSSSFSISLPPRHPVAPTTATAPRAMLHKHTTCTIRARIAELQFYLGPTDGEIIGLRSARVAAAIAHSGGGKKDPVQFACTMISAAAADDQQRMMSARTTTTTTPNSMRTFTAPVSRRALHNTTLSIRSPVGWHLRYGSMSTLLGSARYRAASTDNAEDTAEDDAEDSAGASNTTLPSSTRAGNDSGPVAVVDDEGCAAWQSDKSWVAFPAVDVTPEMANSNASFAVPTTGTIHTPEPSTTSLVVYRVTSPDTTDAESTPPTPLLSPGRRVGSVDLRPLQQEVLREAATAGVLGDAESRYFARDVWVVVSTEGGGRRKAGATILAAPRVVFARVQILACEQQAGRDAAAAVAAAAKSLSWDERFEVVMRRNLPTHDAYGMELQEDQRRMYQVVQSYHANMERCIRRQRWAYVHPSNFFRAAGDHSPFTRLPLASEGYSDAEVGGSRGGGGGGGGSGNGNGAVGTPGTGGGGRAAALTAAARSGPDGGIQRLGRSPSSMRVIHARNSSATLASASVSSKVADLIWEQGIPSDRRKSVYMLLSGAAAHARHEGNQHYRLLVKRSAAPGGVHSVDAAQIDVDIPRTFGRRRLSTVGTPLAVATDGSVTPPFQLAALAPPLRRVLRAFATSHRAVGYCQAMNFIAARFMMLSDVSGIGDTTLGGVGGQQALEEEDAYWLLAAVCTRICPGYYVPSMTGTMADIRVVKDLLHARLPAVAVKVRRLGVPLEGIVSNWLLTLFCGGGRNSMSYHVSQRVLDVLMLEGCNALVAVVFAVFDLAAPRLVRCRSVHEFMDIVNKEVRSLTDAGPLLRSAYTILRSVGPDQLNAARLMVTIEVAAEAEGRMKSKLRRKFRYFDDVAFGECYAFFKSASRTSSSSSMSLPSGEEAGGQEWGLGTEGVVLGGNASGCSGSGGGEGGAAGGIVGGLGGDLGTGAQDNNAVRTLRFSYVDNLSIGLPAFRSLMLELSPQWNRDARGLDRLFVAFDADHNGTIDAHEFMQGIQAMSQVGTREEKLRLLFVAFDARGQGLLGKQELGSLLRTMYAVLGRPAATLHARMHEAAADAILHTLCSSAKYGSGTRSCADSGGGGQKAAAAADHRLVIGFEQFLQLPDYQPDVLKIVSLKLPFESRRSLASLKEQASKDAAASAAGARAAAELVARRKGGNTNSPHASPILRRPSQEELIQLKTSPRG